MPVFGEEETMRPEIRESETGPMAYALQFFRKTISRADGRRCMMYPSCSHYSAQAFEKHGFVKGWIMTRDRLLRCGRDEVMRAPKIYVHGEWKFYDPLSSNDNWWYLVGDDIDPESW